MLYSLFLLVVTLALLFHIIKSSRTRYMSFEDSKALMRDMYAKMDGDLDTYVKGVSIFAYIMYGLYCVYYLLTALYIMNPWFGILAGVQIMLTVFDVRTAVDKIKHRGNVDDWTYTLQDRQWYKIIFTGVLEYAYYSIVIVIIFLRLISAIGY